MRSTVTVIIPAYNSESTLAEALDSIAKQEMPGAESREQGEEVRRQETGDSLSEPIGATERVSHLPVLQPLCPLPYAFSLSEVEILVVDDASTDGTVRVAEEWGQSHPDWANRLQVLHNPGNMGPAASRNHGLRLAQTDWIAFLDADDAWKPHRLRVGWELAQLHPDIAVWSGKVLPLSTRPETPVSNPESASRKTAGEAPAAWREIDLEELAFRNPMATSAVLAKRNAIIEVGGFDTSLRGPEDYDLWLRLAAKNRLALIDLPLSYYRQRPGSLSMDDRLFLPQMIKVFEKAYGSGGALFQRPNRRVSLAWHMLAGAWMAGERKAFGRAWIWFFKAYWLWPFPFPGILSHKWPRLKLMKALIWRYFRKRSAA